MNRPTVSDLMFQSYGADVGMIVSEHEPDLGLRTKPDFKVERDGAGSIVETKEFSAHGTAEPESRIRHKVAAACAQLKPARVLGVPLVVVLTDPAGALPERLSPREVERAVRNELAVHHQYVAAVVVLRETPDGSRSAEVYITACTEAVPIAPNFFAGQAVLLEPRKSQAAREDGLWLPPGALDH
jgi:hypothetical protein